MCLEQHVINSADGYIGGVNHTRPEDIDAIVAAAVADGRGHLVVHFHGGLVNRAEAEQKARAQLAGNVYTPTAETGGWPVFYVWESGAWEVLRNRLDTLGDEPVFKNVLRKLAQYAVEKSSKGHAHVWAAAPTVYGACREEVQQAFNTLWDANARWEDEGKPALKALDSKVDAEVLGAVDEFDVEAMREELAGDEEFQQALATLPVPGVGARFGLMAVPARHSEFSRQAAAVFLRNDGPELAPSAWGWHPVLLAGVARFLYRVLTQVAARYRRGRDHGLHATCMEEALRAFEIGGTPVNEWGEALQWNLMKQATAQAFGDDPDRHAGTALLARLRPVTGADKPIKRITLVGHSTGSIYAAHWLARSAGYLPQDFMLDVIFLAPAITHELWARTLWEHGQRIGNFRMFAMQDASEREDQVWGRDEQMGQDWHRFIYPSSLLYLVSGALESRTGADGVVREEADVPLLGLQRFHAGREVYPAAEFAPVAELRAWLDEEGQRRVVWTPTGPRDDGMECGVIDHSGFNDVQVYDCLRHIMHTGF